MKKKGNSYTLNKKTMTRLFTALGLFVSVLVFAEWNGPDYDLETAESNDRLVVVRPKSPESSNVKAGLFFLIRVYQTLISSQDGAKCKYHPVCSAYGKQVIRTYGGLVGSLMAIDRVLRCNPWNRVSGIDLPSENFPSFNLRGHSGARRMFRQIRREQNSSARKQM